MALRQDEVNKIMINRKETLISYLRKVFYKVMRPYFIQKKAAYTSFIRDYLRMDECLYKPKIQF